MDIIFVLVAMLVIYLIPEILRKRRTAKEYEYPEIPDSMAKGQEELPRQRLPNKPPAMIDPMELLEAALPPAISLPATIGRTEGGNWQGKMSVPQIMNGVIFAEIIGPPRCRVPHTPRKNIR